MTCGNWPRRQAKRYGWFNGWGLRCWLGGCPCQITPLDHEPSGWYCVDCGEQKGTFDDFPHKKHLPDAPAKNAREVGDSHQPPPVTVSDGADVSGFVCYGSGGPSLPASDTFVQGSSSIQVTVHDGPSRTIPRDYPVLCRLPAPDDNGGVRVTFGKAPDP